MAKRFSQTKGPSQHQRCAGELIRHTLAEILKRGALREPALQGVSITNSEPDVSRDFKQINAYAGTLGDGDDIKEVPLGQEYGMSIANYKQLKASNTAECFAIESVTRAL